MALKLLTQAAIELAQIDCGECGGTYAIGEKYRQTQYECGGVWNCPYCKVSWGYSQNNENSRLKKQLVEQQRQTELERDRKLTALNEANQLRFSLRSQKASTTRIKNRVKNGVCPCCTRSFMNLQQHMSTKHPDYAADRS